MSLNPSPSADKFRTLYQTLILTGPLLPCTTNPNLIKLFLCLLPIFTLCRNYEILTRIKDYFTISYGFIIAYIANMQKGKYRFITYTLTALWCAFGFLRFVTLFDGGAMKRYRPNIFLGRRLFE